MLRSKSLVRKMFAGVAVPAMLFAVLSVHVNASVQQPESPEWKQALALYESQKFVAALPLLEKAALAHPENPHVLSRLGFALFAISEVEKNSELRKKLRDRAREVLLKSQSLGDDSNLTEVTLDGLSQEAVAAPASRNAAESAMEQAEAAFVRGDLDAALVSYKRALELDPKLYNAALFAGDSEFKKAYLSKDQKFRAEHFANAIGWFARAVDIDADRETAYRYWGDALDVQGKTEEARDKFVEAIVAEPWNKRAYMGLSQWRDRHNVSMGHPNIVIPDNLISEKGGDVKITLGAESVKEDKASTAVWLMYSITRAGWMNNKNGQSEKFSKAYPGESAYRHSLAEEVEALSLAAQVAHENLKGKQISDLESSVANLLKLKQAGLLEPYVLFVRVDEGIARDYTAYRRSNRDKLRRYWLEMVIPKN